MAEGRRGRGAEWSVTLPSFLWLVVLFVVPSVIVFAIAFKPATPYGGIGSGWTLGTLRSLGNPNYPAIVWRTIWLSAVTTAAACSWRSRWATPWPGPRSAGRTRCCSR